MMKHDKGLAERDADLDRFVLVKVPIAFGLALILWIALWWIFS